MKKLGKKEQLYVILAILLLIILVCLFGRSKIKESLSQGGVTGNELETIDGAEEDEIPTLVFPYDMEKGRLSITSLFQSDVPNPDKDFEEGKNLATIELLNKSEQYLLYADIVLKMVDGTELNFRVEDIPAGKKVWAFELANAVIEAEAGCVSISCTAKFAESDSNWDSGFQIQTDASLVTIANLTDETHKDLDVRIHCFMEDTYFGGLSYKYSIEELLPASQTELEILECYFGNAEVVMITPQSISAE